MRDGKGEVPQLGLDTEISIDEGNRPLLASFSQGNPKFEGPRGSWSQLLEDRVIYPKGSCEFILTWLAAAFLWKAPGQG